MPAEEALETVACILVSMPRMIAFCCVCNGLTLVTVFPKCVSILNNFRFLALFFTSHVRK